MLSFFKKMRYETNEEGFTLIELMIVVVIIGILAAVAIPIFANQQRAAHQAAIKSDVKSLQLIVATYLVNNPTATNLEWRMGSGVEVPGLALNDDVYWQSLVEDFAPSSETTILSLRENANYSSGPGAWNNYYILGANNEEGSTSNDYYRFGYRSITGKYTENTAGG